jgi:hypothetical protein
MEAIEKDPPDKLEDWPDDEAKYEAFGGSEDQSAYDENHEEALGGLGRRVVTNASDPVCNKS